MNLSDFLAVIVPVYNMKPYLGRCIESIVNQSYKKIEIVLINDGSTDGSGEICLKWAERDNRIMYIQKKNEGLGISRNRGIAISNCEYVSFLDADDWIEETFVEKLFGKMVAYGADIAVCDINYVDSVSGRRNISKIRFSGELVSVSENKSAINKARTFACGKIFRKDLFKSKGIYFPPFTFEDIPCTPVLAAIASKIAYVPEPLFNYFRNREDSISNDANNIGDIGRSLKLLHERLNDLGLYDFYRREFKKILLGQVRFAFRKWMALGNKDVYEELECVIALAGEYFSGLKDILERRFFVEGDDFLSVALERAVPMAGQIVSDARDANYIVGYEGTTRCEREVPVITVAKPVAYTEDEESIIWELAETLMEKM